MEDRSHRCVTEGDLTNITHNAQYSYPIVITRKIKRHAYNFEKRKCMCQRIVHKDGSSEIFHMHNPLKTSRYMKDLSNTLVNSQWRWIITTTTLIYSFIWILFGWFWMLIEKSNDDPEHPCVVGCTGYAGYLQLSIETQESIGFGTRSITENCPEGIFLINAQVIIGIAVKGAIVGLIYAKMARPYHMGIHKLFSKFAVICQRDGNLCFLLRLGDSKRSHIVNTELKAYLIETKYSLEGEKLQYIEHSLHLERPGFLIWPMILVHKIVPGSPLYDVSAKDLLLKRFEIIVTLTGGSERTGQTTSTQTSYISPEILWGHRFRECVYWDYDEEAYVVDYSLFNATEMVDTPLCSARLLDEVLGAMNGPSSFQQSRVMSSDC